MEQNTVSAPPEPENKPRFSPLQKTAAIACLLVCFLAARLLTAPECALGTLIVAGIAYVLTAVYVFINARPVSPRDAVIPTVALVLSVGCIFTSVPVLRGLICLAVLVMYIYWVYCALSSSGEAFPGRLAFFDLLKACLIVPIPSMGTLWPALFQKRGGKSNRTLWLVLAGIAIAVVPTAVIIALLSYDAAFTDLLGKITDWHPLRSIFSNFYCVILGIPMAMYLFGLIYASQSRLRRDILNPETSDRVISAIRFAPSPLVAAALSPALVIYVIFFISQWGNYVSAFTGVKPEGVIYSDYAREGFFELCAVAAINAFMILAANLFMRRAKKAAPVLRVYSSVYSVFTLVLIATALSKMALYIGEFGLTRLRLLTSCFMVLLAVCFLALLVAQFVRKLPLVGVFAAAAILALGAVSLTDVDEVIAAYNVNAYVSGKLEKLDVYHFYDLGYGAVPAAVELSETEWLDPITAEEVENYLPWASEDLSEQNEDRTPAEKLFSWSIPRAKAVAALEKAGYLEDGLLKN